MPPTYILVKVSPWAVPQVREALHKITPIADLVFTADGSVAPFLGIETEQAVTDWQQLDALFENRMGLAKRLANRLRRTDISSD